MHKASSPELIWTFTGCLSLYRVSHFGTLVPTHISSNSDRQKQSREKLTLIALLQYAGTVQAIYIITSFYLK